jgi:two-component system, probable response regulator PhcQ
MPAMTDPQPHSILLVDDEDAVRAALRRCLRAERYQILEVSSGAEGLALLRSRPVDIIIADQLMPAMTGIDFLCSARIIRPDTIRIVLTGHADLDVAMRAINEGLVYRFLVKPWDSQTLRVMLRLAVRHLDSERRNSHLLSLVEKHAHHLEQIAAEHPGALSVERDEAGAILIPDDPSDL